MLVRPAESRCGVREEETGLLTILMLTILMLTILMLTILNA